MHESGHKRCRDGSIKNDTDTDKSLKAANRALNSGQTNIAEDAQALTKETSVSVADNAEQTSATIGNKDSNIQKTDEEHIQPGSVQDREEFESQSKASSAVLEQEKIIKESGGNRTRLMPAVLQTNSANAPTPDADNAIGGTLRKSSSEYSESEESSSEEESSSSKDEQEENRIIPTEDIQGQTSVPGSDCGEKETDAMDKNSPEPTVTQNQSEVESSQRPDEETDFSHNSKKSSSQTVIVIEVIDLLFVKRCVKYFKIEYNHLTCHTVQIKDFGHREDEFLIKSSLK